LQSPYHAGTVRRRRVFWPLLLAFGGLGWAAAHTFAYRAATPEHGEGQRYVHYLPTSLALCLGLALGIVLVARLAPRGRVPSTGPSLWLFGVAPVLGFAAHVQAGADDAAIQAGLLLQLLFALVALRLARGVLNLAHGVADAVAGPRPAPAAGEGAHAGVPDRGSPGSSAFPGGHRQRAPPLSAAV
jgi:hypothetical protein